MHQERVPARDYSRPTAPPPGGALDRTHQEDLDIVIQPAFATAHGEMYQCTVESFLDSDAATAYRGRVQLLFTSPPFPLNRKKAYGNSSGREYLEWLAGLAPRFAELLTPDGSIVIEVGNAWEPGLPSMSTLSIEALLAFKQTAALHLCQQFVWHNPARLPTPVQWVNIRRIRVKDTFTHIWWMAANSDPYASNSNVLSEYSPSMKQLLKSGKYNTGKRPSEHVIGETSFLKDNGGAIPGSVLTFSNTRSHDDYRKYCINRGLDVHPARMPPELAAWFIRFLTRPGDVVFDPFAGSCTTGAQAERLDRRWLATEPQLGYVEGSKGRFLEALNLTVLGPPETDHTGTPGAS